MVNDECDASFSDLLRVSQHDRSRRAKRVAVTLSGGSRLSIWYAHAIGLGIVRATRGGRALENLPLGRNLQPMA